MAYDRTYDRKYNAIEFTSVGLLTLAPTILNLLRLAYWLCLCSVIDYRLPIQHDHTELQVTLILQRNAHLAIGLLQCGTSRAFTLLLMATMPLSAISTTSMSYKSLLAGLFERSIVALHYDPGGCGSCHMATDMINIACIVCIREL